MVDRDAVMNNPEPQLQAPEGINITPVPDSEVPGYNPGDIPNHQATAPPPADMEPEPEAPKRVKLGTNTKGRGGPRQLTKKDIEALHGLYGSLALTMSLVHKDGAQQIAESSESCVEAWVELAKQNDSVRRAILAAIEGSAWSAVISAHLPIMLAFVPKNTLERMPLLFGSNMNGDYDAEDAAASQAWQERNE